MWTMCSLAGRWNVGAFILGRNMFGPVRGPWQDGSWKGWWGDNPPYHAANFVLTHCKREPLVMEGGATFRFVAGRFEDALVLAKNAAGSKDIKIGVGVSTVRQYLSAGLIDSLDIASAPSFSVKENRCSVAWIFMRFGFAITERKTSEYATHLGLEKP